MGFSVGQKVRIVKNVGSSDYDKYIGTITTVKEVGSPGFYRLHNTPCRWRPDELEAPPFIKDDLKTGHNGGGIK